MNPQLLEICSNLGLPTKLVLSVVKNQPSLDDHNPIRSMKIMEIYQLAERAVRDHGNMDSLEFFSVMSQIEAIPKSALVPNCPSLTPSYDKAALSRAGSGLNAKLRARIEATPQSSTAFPVTKETEFYPTMLDEMFDTVYFAYDLRVVPISKFSLIVLALIPLLAKEPSRAIGAGRYAMASKLYVKQICKPLGLAPGLTANLLAALVLKSEYPVFTTEEVFTQIVTGASIDLNAITGSTVELSVLEDLLEAIRVSNVIPKLKVALNLNSNPSSTLMETINQHPRIKELYLNGLPV